MTIEKDKKNNRLNNIILIIGCIIIVMEFYFINKIII